MSALSDLLNSQPVTARQAADIAVDKGINLPYGTLAGYWAGKHGRPTSASLKKLAQVVPSLTLKQLQEAAWDISAPLGPYEPPEVAMHLNQWQRRALDDLIRSIVATREITNHGDHDPLLHSAPPARAPHEAPENQEARSHDSERDRPFGRRGHGRRHAGEEPRERGTEQAN